MAYGQEKISGMLALGLCNGFATCLILVVLGLRKWMRLAFTMGDAWLAIALLFNALRMVGDYYINEFGTPLSISMYFATASTDGNISDLMLPDDIQDGLVLAGKLMVLARVSIVFVIWSLNMTFLDVMSASLPRDFQFKRQTFWLMYAVMGATFSTSSISVFLECGDLKLNWTLFPEADKCSYGSLWIITYGLSSL
ncbi:hypothetical protein NUW58_g2617 [Xylaria curta]|uniref:Uncharacterized protein n=1 Tax=Xylaria curta TaxID=42375 RepID=A0ACC1PG07_9PEZI|nr:hypothetical protein NUW58_g2617 [Xylaria curta]